EKMASCRAYIFPGVEDFGIVPVEAQACGKPVVAFRDGGALETIVEGETGVFFDQPEAASLAAAVLELEARTWDPHEIRRNAERFSTACFLERTRELMEQVAINAPASVLEEHYEFSGVMGKA